MKPLLFILLIASSSAFSQTDEFKQHTNGLIYDASTMNRLGTIVDSLNLRFRSCDLSHPYYSFQQGPATWVSIPSGAARKLIAAGISREEFVKKYPRSVKRNLWVIKSYYTNYRNENMIRYFGLPNGYTEPEINVPQKNATDKLTGWIIREDGTEAFYLDSLHTQQLSFSYARLVQYVDCMIDTTATVMFSEARANANKKPEPGSKTAEFLAWAVNFPGKPEYPDYKEIEKKKLNSDSAYDVYYTTHSIWDSLRLMHIDQKMKTDHYWRSVFAEAVQETVAGKAASEQLEFYVSRYGNKADALTLMRSRRVVGSCSMDSRPREHAMNICQLAAETAQWDIFLRSHLNIMNDRFDRASDGSYAWAGRKTYLKELEELDIPAVDLLLGTSLRVSNVSDNHYWGDIGRVGRALADARDKDAVENQLISMMQDATLDLYNRLLMTYIFSHYMQNLEDKARLATNTTRLTNVIKTMPQQIQDVWGKEK